jgi:hypothetical protein
MSRKPKSGFFKIRKNEFFAGPTGQCPPPSFFLLSRVHREQWHCGHVDTHAAAPTTRRPYPSLTTSSRSSFAILKLRWSAPMAASRFPILCCHLASGVEAASHAEPVATFLLRWSHMLPELSVAGASRSQR